MSTPKQTAYARRVFGGEGTSKKQIALEVGYSPSSANSIMTHIENKPGFQNAMLKLAKDSNNLALSAMSEFKARGFKEFSNKDLVGALNAIGSAWSKFNAPLSKHYNMDGPGTKLGNNKLRTIILQRIENQTVNTNTKEILPDVDNPGDNVEEGEEEEVEVEEDLDLDF